VIGVPLERRELRQRARHCQLAPGFAASLAFRGMTRRPRLDPSIFHLPVDRMRSGYYSDKYFVRTRDILLADGYRPRVTMQVFGKQHGFLGGIDEAIAILRLCAADWDNLEVHALYDGDEIAPWETVLLIEGPYDAFAHLETLYLGVLARRTKVGTNVRRVVEAAAPKEVMFFPARHDHWLVQTGDGYAAHIAGAIGVSTDAQASWWGSEGVGTVPHGLIAAYGGDTVLASRKFAEHMDGNTRLVTLVDFENDCVRTTLELADALGDRLYGVRLDTSEMLVDKSVVPQMGRFRPTGVCPQLVWNVRRALDERGHAGVKIVVSGGFNVDKIREFESQGVPVDAYGVGSSLFQGRFDFTADVVRHEGKPCAKVGREFRPNPRLERVI
jgi:nicotinate phosphoribosyltransferase